MGRLRKEAPKIYPSRKLWFLPKTVGVGHPIRIRATIRNFSQESFDGNLQVKLFADQNETAIDFAVVSVGPMASTQVGFTHNFKTAGPKVLHTDIQIADDLPQDNRRSTAINVIEQIKVLLVDGDPSEEWLRGETDFLKLALTPFQEIKGDKTEESMQATGEMKDLIQATSLSFDAFDKLNSFLNIVSSFWLIFKNLDGNKAKELEQFTANGGGVLISSGNQMEIDWYNDSWGSNGSSFLPMPLKDPRDSAK